MCVFLFGKQYVKKERYKVRLTGATCSRKAPLTLGLAVANDGDDEEEEEEEEEGEEGEPQFNARGEPQFNAFNSSN